MSTASFIPIPPTMRRWALYGAGMDNLKLETVPTPEPAPDELLVRHDACGICYSDIKIINLGIDHPRLVGRDMAHEPVVIGHEVSVMVVKVGTDLAEEYKAGQRFTIQVDVFYKGERLTYGYKLGGGMAQYGVIGKEILDGDEGCYLLPLQETTNHAAAALCEPWACVTAAYRNRIYEPETARLLIGIKSNAEIEAAVSKLPANGVLNLALDSFPSDPIPIDIGRIHYDGISIIGVPSGGLSSAHLAYTSNTRTDLKPGGKTLFMGSGGPMGQMHVQRALSLENPPETVVITDINKVRLEDVYNRYTGLAQNNGITFRPVLSGGSENLELREIGEFDDIISLVPSATVVPFALDHLAKNGILNIFAGVPKGSYASIDLGRMITKNQRIIGTTGSSLEDMRHTLEVVESGMLQTNLSLAAIGGLNILADGLESVRSGKFSGKVVIFPNVNNLPLTGLEDLKNTYPDVCDKLDHDKNWTQSAERKLFEMADAPY